MIGTLLGALVFGVLFPLGTWSHYKKSQTVLNPVHVYHIILATKTSDGHGNLLGKVSSTFEEMESVCSQWIHLTKNPIFQKHVCGASSHNTLLIYNVDEDYVLLEYVFDCRK